MAVRMPDEGESAGMLEDGVFVCDKRWTAEDGYVHGRDRCTSRGVGVLLCLQQCELRSKFVAPNMFALAYRCHFK